MISTPSCWSFLSLPFHVNDQWNNCSGQSLKYQFLKIHRKLLQLTRPSKLSSIQNDSHALSIGQSWRTSRCFPKTSPSKSVKAVVFLAWVISGAQLLSTADSWQQIKVGWFNNLHSKGPALPPGCLILPEAWRQSHVYSLKDSCEIQNPGRDMWDQGHRQRNGAWLQIR